LDPVRKISDGQMKCAINLRGVQRFDRGTLSLILVRSKFAILPDVMYNILDLLQKTDETIIAR
jgi:hypothetical protein